MLRDDERYPRSGGNYTIPLLGEMSQNHHEISRPEAYANDDLDDVFGSNPGSPNYGIEIHDSYGGNEGSNTNREVSDIPRLKEKHETEGYRDGVTKGKAESVQAGFDEGYGLGAVFGLRVGKILGFIEGILGAVIVAAKDELLDDVLKQQWVGEKQRLEKVLNEARMGLKTESIFRREWWGEDGIWKFQVLGEGVNSNEVVFTDVASAHPLIKKWERVAEAESRRWRLDFGLMDSIEEPREADEATKDPRGQPGLPASRDLAW